MERKFNYKIGDFNLVNNLFSTRASIELYKSRKNESVFHATKNFEQYKYNKLKNIIYSFSKLGENWDTYGAEAITQGVIKKALSVLDLLYRNRLLMGGFNTHVFPMRDGGIQYEFDNEYMSIELEINPDGDMLYVIYDSSGSFINEVELFDQNDLNYYLIKQPEHVRV